jgi:hypothetical protein
LPDDAGLSLIELSLSMAVMGFLVMGTVLAFQWGLRASLGARQQMAGNNLLQSIHTRLLNMDFYNVFSVNSSSPNFGLWAAYPEKTALTTLWQSAQNVGFTGFAIDVAFMRRDLSDANGLFSSVSRRSSASFSAGDSDGSIGLTIDASGTPSPAARFGGVYDDACIASVISAGTPRENSVFCRFLLSGLSVVRTGDVALTGRVVHAPEPAAHSAVRPFHEFASIPDAHPHLRVVRVRVSGGTGLVHPFCGVGFVGHLAHFYECAILVFLPRHPATIGVIPFEALVHQNASA